MSEVIDTKDIERRIYERVKRGGDEGMALIAHECVDHINAQAEEIKRLREAVGRSGHNYNHDWCRPVVEGQPC